MMFIKNVFWHFFIILFYNLFETYNVHEFHLLNTTFWHIHPSETGTYIVASVKVVSISLSN